jgi:hypothetical protein
MTVLIYPQSLERFYDSEMQHCGVCCMTPRNWIQYVTFVMNILSFTLWASKCICLSITTLVNVQKAVRYCIYDLYQRVQTNILREIQHISQVCVLQTLIQRGYVVANCFTGTVSLVNLNMYLSCFTNRSPTTKCGASNDDLRISRW